MLTEVFHSFINSFFLSFLRSLFSFLNISLICWCNVTFFHSPTFASLHFNSIQTLQFRQSLNSLIIKFKRANILLELRQLETGVSIQ